MAGGGDWWLDWKVTLKEGNLLAVTTVPWSKTFNPWSETFDVLIAAYSDRKNTSDWHVEKPTTTKIYTINPIGYYKKTLLKI